MMPPKDKALTLALQSKGFIGSKQQQTRHPSCLAMRKDMEQEEQEDQVLYDGPRRPGSSSKGDAMNKSEQLAGQGESHAAWNDSWHKGAFDNNAPFHVSLQWSCCPSSVSCI